MQFSLALSHAAQLIAQGQRFLIGAHSRLDGDALGSMLVSAHGLRQLGKEVYLYNPDPVPRRLALLRGNLEELLWRGDLAQHEQSWCQVTLTDPHRPARAIEALRTRFPHTLELRFEPVDDLGRVVLVDRAYTQRLAGRDDLAVCTSFLEHVRSRPADERETAWLSQALTATRLAELDARGVSVLPGPRHRAEQRDQAEPADRSGLAEISASGEAIAPAEPDREVS